MYTDDYKAEPFWWKAAPRPEPSDEVLPDHIDVAIVGAGYTGLHTALQTARAGLSTLVLDADVLGFGCSSRNGGQVSPSIKGSFPHLEKRYGRATAIQLLREGIESMSFTEAFIASENIDCNWERCGRFSGAHSPKIYEATAKSLETLPSEVAFPWHMVPRSDQRSEIGSDFYHGGTVYPDHAALDPGRYHQGLLARTIEAGATAVGDCAVERIERNGNGFRVHTPRGVVNVRQVAIATNGYTGSATGWLRRRVIPIGSYIIATEPLDEDLAAELSPHNRVMSDSRKVVFYYRLSPDRRRMVFGGRVALKETDPAVSAPRLREEMLKLFPQLSDARISHSWMGFVAYTFDELPHVGEIDGMHFAMGYCGSGVGLAGYCGSLMGRKIAGDKDARSVFSEINFSTRPLYSGNPWFLAPSIAYYKLKDRLT